MSHKQGEDHPIQDHLRLTDLAFNSYSFAPNKSTSVEIESLAHDLFYSDSPRESVCSQFCQAIQAFTFHTASAAVGAAAANSRARNLDKAAMLGYRRSE